MQDVTKEWKHPPVVILQQAIFYNKLHEFSFKYIKKRYQSWLESNSVEEKFFVVAFVLYGCDYLLLYEKICLAMRIAVVSYLLKHFIKCL